MKPRWVGMWLACNATVTGNSTRANDQEPRSSTAIHVAKSNPTLVFLLLQS